MAELSGSIQNLFKTNAELTAFGSPWIPLSGQLFVASDTGLIGIGDGVTNYATLLKFKIADITTAALTLLVNTAIANLVDSSPATLDTLNEIAAALGDDPNFSTTIINLLALKAPLDSPTFTTVVIVPQPNPGDSSQKAATTEFVLNETILSDELEMALVGGFR